MRDWWESKIMNNYEDFSVCWIVYFFSIISDEGLPRPWFGFNRQFFRLYLLFSHCRSYPKIFKEIWSLVSWLKMIMSETECYYYYYYYYYRHVICIVACARSPLPSGKIGEGNFSWWEWALYTGYLLYGNETQGLLLWFFALCSMLFTWYKTVMLYWELEVHWNET